MTDNCYATSGFSKMTEKNKNPGIKKSGRGGWRPGSGRPRKNPAAPSAAPSEVVTASARIAEDGSIVIELHVIIRLQVKPEPADGPADHR